MYQFDLQFWIFLIDILMNFAWYLYIELTFARKMGQVSSKSVPWNVISSHFVALDPDSRTSKSAQATKCDDWTI